MGEYPVGLMCRVLRVSYAGFWSWRRNPEGKREKENKRLLAMIAEVFLESGRTYCSPRVHQELQRRGVACSREHVARLMRKYGMRSRHYKRPHGLTQADRCRKAAPNLLDQYFEAEHPNSIWMADITYIPTREGWLYLAAVMDLCTRKIVGWSLKDTLATELTLEAFDRAVAVENPDEDLIHHSDRGAQYSSLRYLCLPFNPSGPNSAVRVLLGYRRVRDPEFAFSSCLRSHFLRAGNAAGTGPGQRLVS